MHVSPEAEGRRVFAVCGIPDLKAFYHILKNAIRFLLEPSNRRRLYIALWQLRLKPHGGQVETERRNAT